MVAQLCGAGFPVTFYARRTEALEAGQRLGGKPAPSPAAVASDADVVILCLYSDDQVRELALGADGIVHALQRDAVLVIHTTGDPRTAVEIAAAAAERGAWGLDAPVSGGPQDIEAGAITLLVGGQSEALNRCEPVLAAYANPVLHLGPPGSGQLTKLVNNLLFGAQVGLVAEASRLLETLGVESGAALAAIAHGSGDSAALRLAVGRGSVDGLMASAGPFIAKDMAVAREVATALGADAGLLGQAARKATEQVPSDHKE